MKRIFTKEVLVALITIASLFILYAGLNYLKGINVFKSTNHYLVRMQNVSELQNSSPVFINGFRVGLVSMIEYEYNNPGNVLVQINLDKKMRVETGSYVKLRTGLTSGGFLELVPNHYVSTYCEPGDTLSGISEPGMMDRISADLLPQVENILPRLDTILMGIQTIVNHPALSASLNHISASTANLEKSSRRLDMLLNEDIPPVMENVGKITSDFAVVSGNLRQLDLNPVLGSVESTLRNIDQLALRLNSNDNSLGLLLNDKSLYSNMDSVAVNLSRLLIDVRQTPKRYVHFSLF